MHKALHILRGVYFEFRTGKGGVEVKGKTSPPGRGERKGGRADGSRSSQGVFTKLVALIKAVTCRSVASMHSSATLTLRPTGAEL